MSVKSHRWPGITAAVESGVFCTTVWSLSSMISGTAFQTLICKVSSLSANFLTSSSLRDNDTNAGPGMWCLWFFLCLRHRRKETEGLNICKKPITKVHQRWIFSAQVENVVHWFTEITTVLVSCCMTHCVQNRQLVAWNCQMSSCI